MVAGSTHTMSKAMLPPRAEIARAEIGLGETNGSDGGRYIVAVDMLPRVAFPDAGDGRLVGGIMASEVCQSVMNGRHWTPLGMSGPPVLNQFAFGAVFL